MHPEPAPFLADVTDGAGPPGAAHWARAADGVRVRVGHWRAAGAGAGAAAEAAAGAGTVLLFPGRTEYIEKYARVAAALTGRGLSVLAIDWRGQGLADRLLDAPRTGHVMRFADYQLDLAAALGVARALSLPHPFHLLGHSMGGCIGLRALTEGLEVASAAFTGPMWGIRIRPAMRPAAWALGWGSAVVGLGHVLAPGTGESAYIASAPFEDNLLTSDPETFAWMQRQVRAHPELELGGPSLHWLREALRECRSLARLPAPDVPCLTFAGSEERIVDLGAIGTRMAAWPGAHYEVLPGARHEVLMERAELRGPVLGTIADHCARAAPPAARRPA